MRFGCDVVRSMSAQFVEPGRPAVSARFRSRMSAILERWEGDGSEYHAARVAHFTLIHAGTSARMADADPQSEFFVTEAPVGPKK